MRLPRSLAALLLALCSACSDAPLASRLPGDPLRGGSSCGGDANPCELPTITAGVEAADTTSKPPECPTPDGCQTKALPTGGGTDSGGTEEPEEEAECDPLDPRCPRPLTAADSVVIRAMWADMRQAFTDTTAARICGELARSFQDALSRGAVRRGVSDIADGSRPHAGAMARRVIHIDAEYLDAAADPTHPLQAWYRATVLQIALHEGAHWARYPDHGPDETWGTFVTVPYNYATRGPGVESCVP